MDLDTYIRDVYALIGIRLKFDKNYPDYLKKQILNISSKEKIVNIFKFMDIIKDEFELLTHFDYDPDLLHIFINFVSKLIKNDDDFLNIENSLMKLKIILAYSYKKNTQLIFEKIKTNIENINIENYVSKLSNEYENIELIPIYVNTKYSLVDICNNDCPKNLNLPFKSLINSSFHIFKNIDKNNPIYENIPVLSSLKSSKKEYISFFMEILSNLNIHYKFKDVLLLRNKIFYTTLHDYEIIYLYANLICEYILNKEDINKFTILGRPLLDYFI